MLDIGETKVLNKFETIGFIWCISCIFLLNRAKDEVVHKEKSIRLPFQSSILSQSVDNTECDEYLMGHSPSKYRYAL